MDSSCQGTNCQSVSVLAGLRDVIIMWILGYHCIKGWGKREECAWHSSDILCIILHMHAQFQLEMDEYSNCRLIRT